MEISHVLFPCRMDESEPLVPLCDFASCSARKHSNRDKRVYTSPVAPPPPVNLPVPPELSVRREP